MTIRLLLSLALLAGWAMGQDNPCAMINAIIASHKADLGSPDHCDNGDIVHTCSRAELTDGKMHCCTWPSDGAEGFERPQPEPIDVPAIESDTIGTSNSIHPCPAGTETEIFQGAADKQWHCYRRTCDDKTRGLWHDEQTPSKWWCRKVQP